MHGRIHTWTHRSHLLEGQREGGIVATNSHDGALQRKEAVLLHRRCNLCAESTRSLYTIGASNM